MAENDGTIINTRNLLGVLGLCVRAGGLICGTDRICEALHGGVPGKTPVLVIEASGNSPNTHKRITDKCTYYSVRQAVIPVSAGELATAVGRTGELAAVGIINNGFRRAVEKQLGVLSDKQRRHTNED